MTARHILSFAQEPGRGGVERALERLAAGWVAAGRRVTLVLGRAGPGAPPGAEVVELGSPGFPALRRLPPVVRERRPDLVFCPGNHYAGAAALLRLRLGVACPPIVGKMSTACRRGDHGPAMRAVNAAWLRTHGRFLDRLVAMTPATAAEAERALGMAGRVAVVPNPPAVPVADADAPPPPGRFILGVGRLARQKRWDRLVAALPGLSDPGVHLLILGEGPERAALEAQARALGVGARLRLPGVAPCPFPAMRGAALLALPSDYEGAPGVLREALSVGTPVVATDASPAVREIVTNPTLGEVVPRGDAPALLAALERRLRPGARRPAPVPQPGGDAAERYLELFDALVAAGATRSGWATWNAGSAAAAASAARSLG